MNYETLQIQIQIEKIAQNAVSLILIMNRQKRVKINRKVAFYIEYSGTKDIVVIHPFTPLFFCRHSLKLLSPTLPKLMNWILLSSPPLSSYTAPPPSPPKKFGTCTLCASTFGTVLENLIIIKLRRLKSRRVGACIIQILQEIELEPALLKIKRTGKVSN